jgi:hypothetical protein
MLRTCMHTKPVPVDHSIGCARVHLKQNTNGTVHEALQYLPEGTCMYVHM